LARAVVEVSALLLARSILPPLRGKSTYPSCSDFRSHLYPDFFYLIWQGISPEVIVDFRARHTTFSRCQSP
jgi:hypothetical protein